VATPIVVWLVYGAQIKAAGLPPPLPFAEWPLWEMFTGTVAYTAWALALPQAPITWYQPALAGVTVLITSATLGLLAPYFQRPLRPDATAGNKVREAHVARVLARTAFSDLKAVYSTEPANIHFRLFQLSNSWYVARRQDYLRSFEAKAATAKACVL